MQQAVTPDLQGPYPCNREKTHAVKCRPLCLRQGSTLLAASMSAEDMALLPQKRPCQSSAAADLQMAPRRQAALVPCRRSEPGHSVGSYGPPCVPFML